MRKYVLRTIVRAILDQPRVPRGYQSVMNAQIAKRVAETMPRRKNKTRTPEERFWRRVSREDSCWLWRGRSMTLSTAPGTVSNTRRWAIEHFAGQIVPAGRCPHPICGHEDCVNPEHQSVERKGLSRLSEHQVAAIKSDSRPYPQIALEYQISRSYVSQIRSGKRRITLFQPHSGFKIQVPVAGPPEVSEIPPESVPGA